VFALGVKAAEQAVKRMGSLQRDKTLVISNAGFVRIGGADSSSVLDALGKVIGVTQGRGTLFAIHDAPNKPLFFFFYNAALDNSLYIEMQGVSDKERSRKLADTPFSIEAFEREFLSLSKNPETLEQKVKDKVFGGNEFRLFMITWLWRKGVSMELRNAILFHDHFCPGVTSGYYIAKYLHNDLPLSKGESYYIIASPVYCKDDALQVILNTTVGKRSMAVIPLSESDAACLSAEAKNAAGLYFRYNRKERKGNGIALSFLWDSLKSDVGFPTGRKPSLTDTLRLTQWMIEHEDEYKNYIRVIKEIPLEGGLTPEDFARPDVNPWLKAGLWKCQNSP
jgi:formylmethanofuran dehydrogenase subunit E-like metal-binding protein